MQEKANLVRPIEFHHPVAFWFGTAIIVFGVLSHVPMFLAAGEMNYRMAGMAMSPLMTFGMYGIVLGTLIVAWGLIPAHAFRVHDQAVHAMADTQLKALDDSRLTPAHLKVLLVLVIALVIDVMKPATLGFIMPGSAAEYGLSKAQTAFVPLAGILGTTMGSFLWGWLGDTIGRRASILMAAIVFIGTSICGAMPSYNWNIFMCWLMGLGAGGMLPIAFALLAELTPSRHRGWLTVLLGAIGTIGGYLAAAGFAALLEPHFSWRIMWFLGLPTGVILLMLNRHIPESPRFLLAQGRHQEAESIFERFGISLVSKEPASPARSSVVPGNSGSFSSLFRQPHAPLTISVGTYGMAWGLVNFGFLLWLPTNLRELGMTLEGSDRILAQSALIAFPATLLGAWLYHAWSTRWTLALFAGITAASLAGFAALGEDIIRYPTMLPVLLVALLSGSSGVIALLSPYTAELFPVQIRSTASGWSAGCSKLAGVATLFASSVGMTAGITVAALGAMTPVALAGLVIARLGLETRGASLEDIQATLHQKSP